MRAAKASCLTPEEKAWLLSLMASDPIPVDPLIAPWLERFNALPGVATWTSCQGHGGEPGYLGLRLDATLHEAMASVLAEAIAGVPGVVEIMCLWYDGKRFDGRLQVWPRWIIRFDECKRDSVLEAVLRLLREAGS